MTTSIQFKTPTGFHFQAVEQKSKQQNHEEAFKELFFLASDFNESTPLEYAKKAYDHLTAITPFLSLKTLPKMKELINNHLKYFSTLRECQYNLALAIGKRLQKASDIAALHYFGKASKIQAHIDTEIEATKTFFQWSHGVLKDKLEWNFRNADSKAFELCADRYLFLTRFAYGDLGKALIKQFYETARDLYIKYPGIFKGSKEKIQTLSSEDPILEKEPLTLKYKKAVKKLREASECNQGFHELFQLLLKDAFLILGESPCSYDLRAMGSIARGEMSPYSDLEWFILIKDQKYRSYFKNLAQLIEMQFISLGETAATDLPVLTCLGPKHKSGLHIDSGANPAHEDWLIDEPKNLAVHQKSKSEGFSPISLQKTLVNSISLSTNDGALFDKYQNEICQILNQNADEKKTIRQQRALKVMGLVRAGFERSSKIDLNMQKELNIKTQFVNPLSLYVEALGLYFEVKETETEKILDRLAFKDPDNNNNNAERPLFSENTTLELKKALKTVYKIRKRLHLAYKEQKDTVFVGGINHIALYPQERESLFQIQALLLKPLHALEDKIFDKVSIDLSVVSFQGALKEKSPVAVQYFVEHLLKMKASAEEIQSYYRKTLDDFPLRKVFYDTLKLWGQDVTNLLEIASKDGLKMIQLEEAQGLSQSLHAITTETPSTIKITAPSFKTPRYLRPEIAKQITDSRDYVQRQKKDCFHPVASVSYNGHNLHFKEKPNHPLMDYAIHSLSYRLFGKTSPPSELVRFEVNGKAYPVLISQTIPGATVKQAKPKNIDPIQYTKLVLTALITKPGDGRSSNYVLGPSNKLYCIDNDVSFVEPIEKKFLGYKVNLSSVLFCMDTPLNMPTLKAFCLLESDLILSGWLEDLITREKEYTKLFTKTEKKQLYNEDPENRFTSNLMFKEGTVGGLYLQICRLQQNIKTLKREIFANDLLKEMITLKSDMTDTEVGPFIAKQYQKGQTEPTLEKKLRKTLSQSQSKSLTSSQALGAIFGKIPSHAEIETKKEYSLEKAKEELYPLILHNFMEGPSLVKIGEIKSLKSSFEKIKDLSRQSLILSALRALVKFGQYENPREVKLNFCTALTKNNLEPFLSKDLKSLDLSSSSSVDSALIELIARECPNLEELYLSRSGIEAFAAPNVLSWGIITLPKLKVLHIANCKNLTTIKIHAENLVELKGNNNEKLEDIDLRPIFPSEMNFANCPNLSVKTLPFWAPKKEEVATIILQTLNYTGDKNDKSHYLFLVFEKKFKVFSYVKVEKNVNKLDLQKKQIGDEGAKALGKILEANTTQQRLDLTDNQIGDEGAKALGKSLETNTTLQTLDLKDNKIGDEGAKALGKALKNNTTLQAIDLRNNQIGDKGAKALGKGLEANTTLRTLELYNNNVGDKGAKALGKGLEANTTLQRLIVDWNQVGDEGVKALGKGLETNTSLQSLHLGYSQVGAEGAKALGKGLETNTSLLSLELYDNQIGAEGAKALGKGLETNTSLQSLELYGNQIGAEGAKALGKALEVNTKLQTIDLRNNQIGDEGAKALGKALEANTTLQTLQLYNNNIGGKGAKALGKGLEANTTLQKLELDWNQIGAEGAKALTRGLETNTSLQSLHLGYSQIGAEGAKALAKGLETNTSLQLLYLEYSQIGAEGAKALAKGLETNTSLQSLYLGYSQIGVEGAKALGKWLESNTALQTLDLCYNLIGEGGAKALAKGLERNKTLQVLYLGGNQIGAEEEIALMPHKLRVRAERATTQESHEFVFL